MKYLLPILIIFFFACKPVETVLTNNVNTEYVQRLVPVILPIETANASAMLECSAEGMVLLSKLNIETSRNAYLSLALDSIGNLSVNTVFDPDTVYLKSDSVIITKDVTHTEIEYRDKELTKWQKLKQEAGGLAIGICLAILIYLAIKLFLKFKK